jgi:hypothetical protein
MIDTGKRSQQTRTPRPPSDRHRRQGPGQYKMLASTIQFTNTPHEQPTPPPKHQHPTPDHKTRTPAATTGKSRTLKKRGRVGMPAGRPARTRTTTPHEGGLCPGDPTVCHPNPRDDQHPSS